MREHRSEWADTSIDAYSAAAIKAGPCSLPEARAGGYGGQVILTLAHTIEHEEFMEVIKLENMGYFRDDMTMPAL
ncbi:Homeobox-leucine zipper protein ATHB-8 [Trifolium repens]|nr:Homeobox-leucine zipper protein ATHB-8 [Trifolium repens]